MTGEQKFWATQQSTATQQSAATSAYVPAAPQHQADGCEVCFSLEMTMPCPIIKRSQVILMASP